MKREERRREEKRREEKWREEKRREWVRVGKVISVKYIWTRESKAKE